jgi:hypothetical protein
MSAFLCTDHHIAALAAEIARRKSAIYEWRDSSALTTAREVARRMAEANLASIDARYGDADGWTDGGFGVFMECCADLAERYYFHPPLAYLGRVEYFKLLDCFEYQSCEVDGWEGTLAARQCNWLRSDLIHSMPEYDAAPWGWNGPEERRVAAAQRPGGGIT